MNFESTNLIKQTVGLLQNNGEGTLIQNLTFKWWRGGLPQRGRDLDTKSDFKKGGLTAEEGNLDTKYDFQNRRLDTEGRGP